MPLRMTKFIRDVGVDRVIVDVDWVHSCGTCRRIRTHGVGQTSNVYGSGCFHPNRGTQFASDCDEGYARCVKVKSTIVGKQRAYAHSYL